MSYTEMGKEEQGIRWDRIGYILFLLMFMVASGMLVKQANNQRKEIINLTLQVEQMKRDHTEREDFLYRELQTLAYETDILSENVKELSK